MTPTFKTVEIPCRGVSTLAWARNQLIDTTTNQTFNLDGSFSERCFFMGYEFDRGLSVQTKSDWYTIAYKNRETKAVILKNGKVHRQLNRDYYCAGAFDYPIIMACLESGRVIIAHCPDSYDTVAFEDAETGETLGSYKSDGMEFHSRLQFSPGNQRLLSAGWFWHPAGAACIYDLNFEANAASVVTDEMAFSYGAEIANAAFLGKDRVVVATSDENFGKGIPANGLGPQKLGVWSIPLNRWLHVSDLAEPAGTIMPWREHIVSCYGHPKLIDLATGQVVHRWDQINSGMQKDSIDLGEPEPPAMALDPVYGRFAVSGPQGITVVSLQDAVVEQAIP